MPSPDKLGRVVLVLMVVAAIVQIAVIAFG
jgi:hypothetical protein